VDGCHASQVQSRLPRPLPLNYACRQCCFHRQLRKTTSQSLQLTFKPTWLGHMSHLCIYLYHSWLCSKLFYLAFQQISLLAYVCNRHVLSSTTCSHLSRFKRLRIHCTKACLLFPTTNLLDLQVSFQQHIRRVQGFAELHYIMTDFSIVHLCRIAHF